MEKKLIEMGKQYTTQGGLPVRVLCVDCKDGEYKVVALVGDTEVVENYTAYGEYHRDGSWHVLDLKEKPVERKLYLEVYTFKSWEGEYNFYTYRSKEDLQRYINNEFNEEGYVLLATKEITFTEGEFV